MVGYSSRTGDRRWTHDVGEAGVAGTLSSDGQLVYVVSVVEQSRLLVTMLNGSNGELVKTQQLHAPWLSSETTR